jgi:molybdopterin-guanine dinucleotide biosynthesis protein A
MPPARISDCTGALVAGGRATRLGGVAKGLLRVEGVPIAARTLALFRALFDEALVVSNDPAPYASLGVPVVPDAIPGKGAPGGVHAALAAAATGWVFTAACDMPFVSEPGIRLLAGRRTPAAEAVVVRWEGRFEPLHALWSRAALPAIAALLSSGDPSLQAVARAVKAIVVEEDEWRTVDPLGRAFANANTPDDLVHLGLAPPR